MSENWEVYADWNPWHGCTKISPGCKYCYVYRQDEMPGHVATNGYLTSDVSALRRTSPSASIRRERIPSRMARRIASLDASS